VTICLVARVYRGRAIRHAPHTIGAPVSIMPYLPGTVAVEEGENGP